MDAKSFFSECNAIISGAVKLTAFDGVKEDVSDFAVDEYFEDDFLIEEAAAVDMNLENNNAEGVEAVKPVVSINLAMVPVDRTKFVGCVTESVAPGEPGSAITVWNKQYDTDVTTVEELCRQFARRKMAVEFSDDVVVSDLDTQMVECVSPSPCKVSASLLQQIADLSEDEIFSYLCLNELLSRLGVSENQKKKLCHKLLSVSSAVTKGWIEQKDLCEYLACCLLNNEYVLNNTGIVAYNVYCALEIINRLHLKMEIPNDIGSMILIVAENRKVRITDTTLWPVGLLSLPEFTNPRVSLLSNNSGIIIYDVADEEMALGLLNISYACNNSIENWANSEPTNLDMFERTNLLKVLNRLEACTGKTALEQLLKAPLNIYWGVDRALGYTIDVFPELINVFRENDVKRILLCIQPHVYVANRGDFLRRFLKSYFGSLYKSNVTKSEAKECDCSRVFLDLNGREMNVSISAFFTGIASLRLGMKEGVNELIVSIKDNKFLLKIH